jgi:hypothetical protein
MMAGGDMSPLLRQGGTVIAMQPALAPDFAKSLFANVSDAGHARRITNIERDGDFPLAQSAGVDFAIAGKTDGGDEFFAGAEILERIPVLRTYVRKSDQVFGGSLDGLRLSLFKVLADDLRAGSKSWGREPVTYRERPQAFKDIARFVNIATGRADKGPHNSALTQAYLNLGRAIGFAPGYRVSRFQFLTLPLNRSFWHADPTARRVVYKNYVRWLGTQGAVQGTLYGLGWITGGMVTAYFDPDDDDFLKVKFGNLRLDLTGGLQVPARFLGRMALEGYRGLVGEVTPGMAGESALNTGIRFMQTGLDPRLSLAVDWYKGETVVRKPFSWFGDYGVDGAIGTRMLPIGLTSAVEVTRKEGAAYSVAQSTAEFFGAGSQVYPDRADEPNTKAERLASRFAAQGMKGGKPRTEEVRRKLDELKGRARKGEDVRGEVEPLVEDEVISKGHGESIIKAKDQTLLQEKFRQLSLEDAKHVLKYATQAEREAVADIVRSKALNKTEREAKERQRLEAEKEFEKRRAELNKTDPQKAAELVSPSEARRRKAAREAAEKRRKQEVKYGRGISP